MSKRLLPLIGLVFLAAGCSRDVDNNSAGLHNSNKKMVEESYQLTYLGCDTGIHTFRSTSAADVHKQKCMALQNHKLNNSCNEDPRRAKFNQECPDFVWTPVYEKVAEPANPVIPANPVTEMARKESKVRDSLKHLLADSFKVETSLNRADQAEAKKIGEAAVDCGFEYQQLACFGTDLAALVSTGALLNINGQMTYFVELVRSESNQVYIFKIDEIDPVVKTSEVTIGRVLHRDAGRVSEGDLSDPSKIAPLVTVKLTANPEQTMWARVEKPRNIRELLHSARRIVEANAVQKGLEATKAKVALDLAAQGSLISGSDNEVYQRELLLFAIWNLPVVRADFAPFFHALLQAKFENIRQTAAVYWLLADPTRDETRTLVVKALGNANSGLRRDAIRALAKVKTPLTKDDQNAVLSLIGDVDYDVRTSAYDASKGMALNAANEGSVEKIAKSNESTSRQTAALLFARINTPAANFQLIKMMDDDDYSVRTEVATELKTKKLGEDTVVPLSVKLTKASASPVRESAARLLAAIGGDTAILALIGQMNDPDYNVRTTIVELLKTKTMTSTHQAALSEKLKASESPMRESAARLLATVPTDEAVTALIGEMSDSDYNVRRAIVDVLNKRAMIAAYIPALSRKLTVKESTVRADAARLLAKISADGAVTALIGHMADSDYNVRTAIAELLSQKTLNDNFVAALNAQFSADEASVRSSVARLLGKIKSEASSQALTKRLLVETDYNVKIALTDALKK